ncbi:peptidoglycan DD-metalloendopeptidase family protein [Lamprobacter sp.]|uniref:peptidoglycan DD-metalloendopeptidase family protein n=1 Tax=Lamprobacter sp. TaxID=3100796 RepID=UPI002B26181A|nr:peptidoglycan DD-metalloendopeptidase family protein [Lamprobacter sp.]
MVAPLCFLRRFGRFWARSAALLLVLVLMLDGCAGRGFAPVEDRVYGPAPPGFYRVRSGDTLSEIAEDKRISMRKLAAWNNLGAPYPIYAGQLLRIEPPRGVKAGGGTRKVAARSSANAGPKTGPKPPSPKPASKASANTGVLASPSAKPGSAARASGVTWAWPVSGRLVQEYRSNDRTRQGIRIAAAAGTPVTAAADGEVVYSGSSGLAGYGNLIIVKHSPRYLSAYGFNRLVLASEGASVKRGQQLAEVGQAADGRPMLHFEIRRDGATVDPLLFLPASR